MKMSTSSLGLQPSTKMFKLFCLALVLGLAAAAPKPSVIQPVVAYSAPAVAAVSYPSYSAPVAYSAPVYSASVAAPVHYSASVAAPVHYSASVAAPVAYSAPVAAQVAYSAPVAAPVVAYSAPVAAQVAYSAPAYYSSGSSFFLKKK
ncbi:cuticle protein 16.5-like [Ostrinia nubilalis]|uniref:cuticle protein 16.5-like n=1 Tax=Ostrinia nubilalis TaxID=29057 RepID=UPI003082456E